MLKVILLQILLEWLALNCSPSVDATAALGAQRFAVREEASRALERSWPLSDSTLRRTAESKDFEASERALQILDKCRRRALEQAGPAPWADWPLMRPDASSWDGGRWPWLAQRIQRDLPPAIEDAPMFHQWQRVSEQWARQALDAGVPPTAIRIWFAVGRSVDAKWRAAHKPAGQYEWDKMP
jgi:hypothetical protein